MKTDEEILYENYLAGYIAARNEAVALLNKRDFESLTRDYVHWIDVGVKQTQLESSSISDVIKELGKIESKVLPNETTPMVYGGALNEDESVIYAESAIYTIVGVAKCEKMAKSHTKTGLWKMKYQPNGRDAKGCMEIINRFKNV